MGWLWPFSSSKPVGTTPTQTPVSDEQDARRDISLSDDQRMRIFGRPGPAAPQQQQPPQQPSAPQQPAPASTDAEVEAFLNSFASPATTSTSTDTPSATPSLAAPPPPQPPSRIRADGSIDISAEALLPRHMSCRQAFDQAFYCQSLGGKFNDVYRYGAIQSCSEQWGAFWFCMRIRTFPEAQRQALIADYYREREATRRAARNGASSEDVWQVRDTALMRAFDRDPEAEGTTELEKEVLRRVA